MILINYLTENNEKMGVKCTVNEKYPYLCTRFQDNGARTQCTNV